MPNLEFDESIKKTLEACLAGNESVETRESNNLETDDGNKFDSLTVLIKSKGTICSLGGHSLLRIQGVIANIHPAYTLNSITAHYWMDKNELEIHFTRSLN